MQGSQFIREKDKALLPNLSKLLFLNINVYIYL